MGVEAPPGDVPALPVGQIGGEKSGQRRTRLPLADPLIGVTASELGYSVVTVNFSHFQLIPGLSVMRF
jgi:predicted nucleic acid-binding protein